MRIKLVTFTIGAAVLALAAPVVWAGPGGQGGYAIETGADREIIRRQQNIAVAEDAMRRGDAALKAGDIKSAYLSYKQAVDLLPAGHTTRSLRARALARYSSTAVRYAEYLVSEGEYALAESVAREVLEARYNPDYRPAAVFLSRLEQPDYFNKTITPEFAEDREKVERLLREANGYYDSARYDMALKRYQQVLAVDKYNAAAFRGMEQVELGKQRYYDSAYNETRSRMLWQVDKAWERPKRRFAETRTTDSSALQDERRGTELMIARLNRIVVPRIDFRDATVREAVAFLQQQSRTLDTTETSPEQRGINIFLKLPSVGAAIAPPVGDFEDDAPAPVPRADTRITLNLSNVPLYEALRYVATLAGLKVKVEPFAVSLVPLSEPTDTLEQREFRVPPGFIAGGAAADDSMVGPGRQTTDGSAPRLTARQNAKDFLESQGVQFPTGASATFNPGSSRLVIRNTAPNLDLIESLVEAALGEQPTQVEIESKFVEITQNNLKELGFDWALGPFSIPGSDGVFGSGGSIISPGQAGNWPFVNPGTGQPVGQDSLTSGLRSGSGSSPSSAVSINSLNALLAQNAGFPTGGGAAPGIFSIAGVFTNPQFQMVIRALNQQKGADLMAAPRVTTKSGQEATIRIARKFPYPQEYDPPQVPRDSAGGNTAVLVTTGAQADPIVTPSFPRDFTTRDLGVTLKVTPLVGPDGYTIDLELSPEVVDFDGFINYGSPIFAPRVNVIGAQAINLGAGLLTTQPVLAPFTPEKLTDNVINQPIFSVRKVTTSVSIWDGQTVALGGLIREDVQKVADKVPVLGDIPFAGALFRSEVDQKIKQNLIVFVTARLMDAAGQPLRPEDDLDQEELVEPLGLPEDLRKPSITAKGFRQK
jgi:general secretion pathway protein D